MCEQRVREKVLIEEAWMGILDLERMTVAAQGRDRL
jgi:hypothetical protein